MQYLVGGSDFPRIVSEIRRVLVLSGRQILIEQASLSGRSSGSVARASMESDYIPELSKDFRVKTVRRIRSRQNSKLSTIFIRMANCLPGLFVCSLNWLARREMFLAQRADESYLLNVPYYDILIEA